MEVVSRCPLPAASRVSPSARGGFTLTIVCKATFLLMPGESPLDSEQEAPNEEDNYWDDDPGRSLYSPGDLIPFKPRADIVLVGHAFAPGQAPARSIPTRLVVGEVDKGIEAFCDRSFTLEGQLREGPMVTRVPLRYERAAGGPGTWNPVGMRPDVTDAYGSIALPNMQRPGTLVSAREDYIEPIGYGPLAPTWPMRQEKLGYLSTIWDSSKWYTTPLPDRMDFSFFNVAPPDQQLSEIRPNERIVLENLHPEHPRLVTSLPGVRPRAVLARPGQREEIALKADTLWIDTALSVCTVVWRAQVALSHRQEAGQVVITLASQPATAGGFAEVRAPAHNEIKANTAAEEAAFRTPMSPDDPDGAPTAAISLPNRKPVMPFSGGSSAAAAPLPAPLPFKAPSAPVAPPSSPAAAGAPPAGAGADLDDDLITGETLKLTRRDVIQRAALPFMQRGDAAPAPAPMPIPEAPPAPPPPIPLPMPSAPSLQVSPPPFVPPPPTALSAEAPAPAAPPPPPVLPITNPDLPPAPPMIGPLARPGMDAPSDGAAPQPAADGKNTRPKIDEVTVETCGAIAASLARRKDEAAKILEERSITAADWKLVEKHWAEAIRKETDRGRTALLKAYDAAYVAQLEKERGPITVVEYAHLVVASERGAAAPVLEEMSLPKGSFMRIERVWLERVAEDDALAADVRKAILAARLD